MTVCVPQQQVGLQSIRVRQIEGRLVMFQEGQELFGIQLWIPIVISLWDIYTEFNKQFFKLKIQKT